MVSRRPTFVPPLGAAACEPTGLHLQRDRKESSNFGDGCLTRAGHAATLRAFADFVESDFDLERVGEYPVRGFSDPIELFAYHG